MRILVKNPVQIITVDTKDLNFKRGNDMQDINPIIGHSIVIEDGFIKDFIPESVTEKLTVDQTIDVTGMIVLPGLVECHTHSAFAGSRSNEFFMRLKGSSYEEIAAQGGGILSTVNAVRTSSFEELVVLLKPRIDHFISQGITTLEIKSGYGLSFYDEIKLLQVINYFRTNSPIEIIPTFLGAHTFPPEYKNDHEQYLDLLIKELLPYIIKNNLAYTVDAYCEKSAFSPEEVDSIFAEAKKLGYKLKIHTDQFNQIGGLNIAMKYNVNSADHLEVIDNNEIKRFSKSEIVAVLLPGVSFSLDTFYAPARKLIDNNAIVAISTDYNPGSSNISNLHLIMLVAAIKMKMTAEEIISAVTVNAAKALNLSEKTGSIEVGKQADFSVFKANEYSEIIYNIGTNLNKMTIKKGKIIYKSLECQ